MKTILVVDDELGSADVLGLILGEEGYRTAAAVNGQQALALARELRPDLVIADYMMPVMNGIELARALRADPALARTRIVMNSGLPESTIRALFDGYDAFLRKPYNVHVLLSLVRQLLDE